VPDFRPRTATQTRVRADLSQVTAQAHWEAPGLDFLAGQEVRQKRGQTISVDPSVNRIARELLAAAAPAIARVMDLELGPPARRAFDDWPIGQRAKPVHSKELLALEWRVLTPTRFAGAMVNRAPYATNIRRGRTFRTLIRRPVEEAAERMVERLGGAVARAGDAATGRI